MPSLWHFVLPTFIESSFEKNILLETSPPWHQIQMRWCFHRVRWWEDAVSRGLRRFDYGLQIPGGIFTWSAATIWTGGLYGRWGKNDSKSTYLVMLSASPPLILTQTPKMALWSKATFHPPWVCRWYHVSIKTQHHHEPRWWNSELRGRFISIHSISVCLVQLFFHVINLLVPLVWNSNYSNLN